MNFYGNIEKSDIINDIIEISDKIEDETDKENINSKNVTKLMFEQMLKGLYLQL